VWHTNDEARLVERARRGSREAFSELVERHQARVFRLCVRMVGIDGAEDVAQQAFVRAWLGLSGFAEKAAFATWLYRLAINCCLDSLRRTQRARTVPLPEADPLVIEDVAVCFEQAEDRELLRAALDELDAEDRLLLHLRVVDELSYAEIGGLLHLNPTTVGTRLYRARARLHALVVRLEGAHELR
jgi:RNA polymerase sigma-70 factor (ECF subfamily)